MIATFQMVSGDRHRCYSHITIADDFFGHALSTHPAQMQEQTIKKTLQKKNNKCTMWVMDSHAVLKHCWTLHIAKYTVVHRACQKNDIKLFHWIL